MVTFKDYLEHNHPDYYNQLVEDGHFSGIGGRIKKGLLGATAALSLLTGAPNRSDAVEQPTKTSVTKKSNLQKFTYLRPLEKIVQKNGYKLEVKGNDIYVELDFGDDKDLDVAPGAGGPNDNYVPTQGSQPSEIMKDLKDVLLKKFPEDEKLIKRTYELMRRPY
jgi:hypothetical protein